MSMQVLDYIPPTVSRLQSGKKLAILKCFREDCYESKVYAMGKQKTKGSCAMLLGIP